MDEAPKPSFGVKQDKILDGLRSGLSAVKACEGVTTRQTFYRWLKDQPDFAQEVAKLRGPIPKNNLTRGEVINPAGKGGLAERPEDTGGRQGTIVVAQQAQRLHREGAMARKERHAKKLEDAGMLEVREELIRRMRAKLEETKGSNEIPFKKHELDSFDKAEHTYAGMHPKELANESLKTPSNPNPFEGKSLQELLILQKQRGEIASRMLSEMEKASRIIEIPQGESRAG